MELRPIHVIASEIYRLKHQWPQAHFNNIAKHYLEPLLSLSTTKDNYILDRGDDAVAYFLSNTTVWKGEDARRIKNELKAHLKANR